MKKSSQAGFTLIELLITMVIGLLVLGAVSGLFNIQQHYLANQEQIAEMQQNVRMAMDIISRELRMAGYNPTGTLLKCSGTSTATTTACAGIVSAQNTSIGFTADLNGNGAITADTANSNENIHYALQSIDGLKVLVRTANGAMQPLVENITTLSFTYYDDSGNVTTALSSMRRIQISITGQTKGIDPTTGQIRTYNLTANIVPVNLPLLGGA